MLGFTTNATMPSCSQSDPTTNVRIESSRCKRGEASEPASEQSPITAMSAPICAAGQPLPAADHDHHEERRPRRRGSPR